jgi:quercetin dioxygenase-like cupin family protein
MDTPNITSSPRQDPVSSGRSFSLKLRGEETGDSIMMFEETIPAGTKSTFHLHHDSDEVAYVLSGEVTFKIGDEVTVGGPGTCAFMPRGVPHAWKSTGTETGRALFLYTPARARRADRRAAADRPQIRIDDQGRAGRDAAAPRLGAPRSVAVVTPRFFGRRAGRPGLSRSRNDCRGDAKGQVCYAPRLDGASLFPCYQAIDMAT